MKRSPRLTSRRARTLVEASRIPATSSRRYRLHFLFKELHGQVNFIEYYLLSGNTFVENVAVEIGANSTNLSWRCSNGHGVDFLLVSGHDTIEHVS